MKIEEILKDILKKGQCPDCDKKATKCNCNYKELFITVKINDIKKSIEKFAFDVNQEEVKK